MAQQILLPRILALFALTALAVSAAGRDTPARFSIERIEVRNAHRVSPRLIIAETLLREGREVSADEVRRGVERLAHLPFILSARFTVEQGSQVGRAVVVIDVTEFRPVSFLLDGRGIGLQNGFSTFDYDYSDPTVDWRDAAVGVRWLAGGGIVQGGMTVLRSRHEFEKNFSAWELGYTRYGLFGSRLFATVKVRTPVDSVDEGTFAPALVAGIPLTASQTLTVDFQDTPFVDKTFRVEGASFQDLYAERRISAAWTFDSTNEPFAATRGTFVRIAPLLLMRDVGSVTLSRQTHSAVGTADHGNAAGVDLAALHYWELSPKHSVSGGVIGGWATIEDRRDPALAVSDLRWRSSFEILQAGYSRSLGKSRLQFDARAVRYQRSIQEGTATFGPEREPTFEGEVSWVRRSTWGTLRLGFAYVEH